MMSRSELPRNIIVAFIAVFVFLPIGWMLMDREPPYTFEHVELSPSTVEQGGELHITFTVRQNRPACSPGLVYREFKEASGKLHVFDPVLRSQAPIIADDKFTRISRLPESISPGPTLYRGVSCYTCNPIHSWLRWPVCAPTPAATFNITEKPNAGARQ